MCSTELENVESPRGTECAIGPITLYTLYYVWYLWLAIKTSIIAHFFIVVACPGGGQYWSFEFLRLLNTGARPPVDCLFSLVFFLSSAALRRTSRYLSRESTGRRESVLKLYRRCTSFRKHPSGQKWLKCCKRRTVYIRRLLLFVINTRTYFRLVLLFIVSFPSAGRTYARPSDWSRPARPLSVRFIAPSRNTEMAQKYRRTLIFSNVIRPYTIAHIMYTIVGQRDL